MVRMDADKIAKLPAIQILSSEVQSQLRSGVSAPSVVQCVEELVVNSIDAGASCIAVRVDLPNCKVQVMDNGRGITHQDMTSIGERYATSKCHDIKDLDSISHYGYRGEALASIRDVSSILEINSRTRGSSISYSKLFHHGKVTGISEDSRTRPSAGTTITAHNIFYNMPVRRKILNCPLVYEQIYKRLQGIALIHPCISFTLRDDNTGAKSIQTHNTASIVKTFGYLFGRDLAAWLKEVEHVHANFRMSGFIGVSSYRNKSLQFLFVNGRLVLKTKVHKLINLLLGQSLITKKKARNQDAAQRLNKESHCQPSPGSTQGEYGIFVIDITCPRNEYDITLEPAKTLVEFRNWSVVLSSVHELVSSFLVRENLTISLSPQVEGNLDLGESSQESDSAGCPSLDSQRAAATVCAEISTDDCRNAVHSTCVRRQKPVVAVEPAHSADSQDSNPADYSESRELASNIRTDEIVDAGLLHCKPSETETENDHAKEDCNGTKPNSVQSWVAVTSDTRIHDQPQEASCVCSTESAGTDLTSNVSLICGEVIDESPCPQNEPNSAGSNTLTSTVVCSMSSSAAGKEDQAPLCCSSSGLDTTSSEGTLSSSEVEDIECRTDSTFGASVKEMRTEKADYWTVHQATSQMKAEGKGKLSMRVQNSLAAFRRSLGKEKQLKTFQNKVESSKETSLAVPVTAPQEHKTIALRWYRSPGFRSRLAGFNIKCQDRQESTWGVMTCPINDAVQTHERDMTPEDVHDGISAGERRNELHKRRNQTQQVEERDCPAQEQRTDIKEDGARKGHTEACSVDSTNYHACHKLGQGVNTAHGDTELHNDSTHTARTMLGCVQDEANKPVHICSESRRTDSSNAICESSSEIEPRCRYKRPAPYSFHCPISNKERKTGLSTAPSGISYVPPKSKTFLTSDSFLQSSHNVLCTDRVTSLPSAAASFEQSVLHRRDSFKETSMAETVIEVPKAAECPIYINTSPPRTQEFSVCMGDENLRNKIIQDIVPRIDSNTIVKMSENTNCHPKVHERIDAERQKSDKSIDQLQCNMRGDNFATDELVKNRTEDVRDNNLGEAETLSSQNRCDMNNNHSMRFECHSTDATSSSIAEKLPILLMGITKDLTGSDHDRHTGTTLQDYSAVGKYSSAANTDIHVTEVGTCHEDKRSFIETETSVIATQDCKDPEQLDLQSKVLQQGPLCQSNLPSEESSQTKNKCNGPDSAHGSSSSSRDTAPHVDFVVESRDWYSIYDVTLGRKLYINRTNGNCSLEMPDCSDLDDKLRRSNAEGDLPFTMITKSDSLAQPHFPHSAASFVASLRDRRGRAAPPSTPSLQCMTPGAMATLDAAMEDGQTEDEELVNVKWGTRSREQEAGDAIRAAQAGLGLRPVDSGPTFLQSTVGARTAGLDAKFQAKLLASLNPCQFTKSMFQNIRILGQLDAKFIACLVNSEQDLNPAGDPNLLVLVDQHAAHERIRLEMLLSASYTRNEDGELACYQVSSVTPPLSVSLSASEIRLMQAFHQKLGRVGISFTVAEHHGSSVNITQLPACVVEREANEVKRGRQTVAVNIAETLIKEQLDLVQGQSGAVSSLPKTVTRILNSQACHGAIKFGDTLDLDECKALIGQLSSCDLPFQCAHGRPALMPILDLRKLRGQTNKESAPSLRLWKLRASTSAPLP